MTQAKESETKFETSISVEYYRVQKNYQTKNVFPLQTSAATASTLQPVLLDRKPVAKVPTVASEKELQDILEARSNGLRQRKKSLDPRKARALRRKLYLDLYGEMSQRMLIQYNFINLLVPMQYT